jgi:hypothetical protein
MVPGVWLTRIGADQVKAKSVDIANAMPVYCELLKRVFCQPA